VPAFDVCHDQSVNALQKEGWRVDDRPQQLKRGKRAIFIDVRATRSINGSSQQILLVEIKCFVDRDSTTRELYTAIGQYIIYRAMLSERRITTPLYLAVPDDVYRDIFDTTVQRAITDSQIKLVVVNLDSEVVMLWKE